MRGRQLRELIESTAEEWQAAYEGRVTPTSMMFADEDAAARLAECLIGDHRIAA